MSWDKLVAQVYNITDKGDFVTYFLKLDALQYGFAVNDMKVIVYKQSGSYRIYKPSAKVSYAAKPISHFDYVKQSNLGIAIEEACLRAVDDYDGTTITRLSSANF